jgi:hypothetical protein
VDKFYSLTPTPKEKKGALSLTSYPKKGHTYINLKKTEGVGEGTLQNRWVCSGSILPMGNVKQEKRSRGIGNPRY